MRIDCETCVVRGDACSDCVVSFLTIPVRDGAAHPRAVDLDSAQEAAIENLANGGLVRPLRHAAG